MLKQIDFIFGEALQALRRHPILTVAAITTVSVALLLVGSFGYVYFRVEAFLRTLPSQFEIRVYLKDDLAASDKDALAARLQALTGVKKVDFKSKEAAWDEMLKSHPELPSDIDNPLPDSYSLTFTTVKSANSAVSALERDPAVEKLLYEQEVLNFIRNALSLIRYVGIFGLILLVIGGTIIFNAIRLTILARRIEIRIMQLVGATRTVIELPFLIEGMVQGAIGGFISSFLLAWANSAFARSVSSLGFQLPGYPLASMALILGLAGALLGGISSFLAIRLPMRSA